MTGVIEVLDLEPFGISVELLRTGEDTGGQLLEMEVVGRPRGFFSQRHVHPHQVEVLEMVAGAMKVAMNGRDHVIREGQSLEIPAGTPHTQVPLGTGPGRVRIQVRPAGDTRAFLEYLAELARDRKVMRSGYPRPVAAAELITRFSSAGHASAPPLALQRALAGRILALGQLSRPYVFVDEWDVAAPPQAVFDVIADARSYPNWWRPVYLEVTADGAPGVGSVSRQHFKGRLPYHLRTRSVVSEFEPPTTISADVDGDLRGRGTWTLTPTEGGTHVQFDWRVNADRRLLRLLTPVLRPVFRWNHSWAIKAAIRGLEPYARGEALAATGTIGARSGSTVKAHRAFDPRRVGALECEAWVAYYRRDWIALLRASILVTHHTFGLPWPATIRAAWLVMRANQLWAPFPDNDPAGARRAMEHFYRLVARHHGAQFDAARAAELEVEWWRAHREHQHDTDGDPQPLVRALTNLYAYVYGVSEDAVRMAAEQRALAMVHSDHWVKEGVDPDSPLIDQERAALVRSYAALLAAVHE